MLPEQKYTLGYYYDVTKLLHFMYEITHFTLKVTMTFLLCSGFELQKNANKEIN
jgi:hypothetical protein